MAEHPSFTLAGLCELRPIEISMSSSNVSQWLREAPQATSVRAQRRRSWQGLS